MKKLLYPVIALILWSCSSSTTIDKLNKLNELEIRNGLPSFKKKLQNNDTLTIAYFGGSITYADGWRNKSFNWLKDKFPGCHFIQVNAAIGGTKSQLGAFRVNKHVLSYKPDLVFVEFAVNDYRLEELDIQKSMEGIVRQIWQSNNETGICFIYTLKQEGMLEKLLNGEQPHTVVAMEKVAAHYGIPSISFAKEVCKQLESNKLIMKGNEIYMDSIPVFSKDGVHPYKETGHEIYARVFERCMASILEKEDTKATIFPLAPLNADNWEKTKMVDLSEIELAGSWKETERGSLPEKVERLMPKIMFTKEQGDKAIVEFTGKKVGFFDVMGPQAGRVIVSVDGEIKDTVFRFDKYCRGNRINYHIVSGLKDTIHTATFEFLNTPFDKESILKEMNNTIENPGQYLEDYKWYIGSILLEGELVVK